ncbi:MAG: hypothetical protein GC181_12560 [Bacteroidetes bacterium]|nr:hypothetical protein [Bacteroidota bacterium]
MRHLFLADSTIDHLSFEDYKSGMVELSAIDRVASDQFNKSPNAINSLNYANLYQQYSQENQLLAVFIEQLRTCEETIISEEDANSYCLSTINGFIGIDFSSGELPTVKAVTNQMSYDLWSFNHSSSLQRLDSVVGTNVKFSNFSKEFLNLSEECQEAIIDLFQRAKDRELVTPFYPDTKITKDVTQSKFKHSVWELRVYSPVALRVYFHETSDKVYLIGIKFKSSTNQSHDINNMYEKLENLLQDAI